MREIDLLNHLYGERCKTSDEYINFLKINEEKLVNMPDDMMCRVMKHKAPDGLMERILKRPLPPELINYECKFLVG